MADKAELVTVCFTRSYTVRDEEGRTYSKDEVVELTRDSAAHFIKRGAAVEHDPKAKPKADGDKPKEES